MMFRDKTNVIVMCLLLGQLMTISISNSVWGTIIKHHANLRRYINMDSLIPQLNKYEILTSGEREQLNMDKPCQQKVDLFLQFLERKSEESMLNFLKALEDAGEHTGHRQLHTILRNGYQNKLVHN